VRISKRASILATLLALGMTIAGEGAHSQLLAENTIFLDPPVLLDELNNLTSFTININISYIEGLHGWSLKLRYNPELLYTNSSLIKEGPFLRSGGSTFWALPFLEEDYLTIGSMINGQSWADGSGTLANITFSVKRRGETILHPFDTELDDVNADPIIHTSQDGYFRNIVSTQMPRAGYTYFAQVYNVTFDASSSYSPGGTVQNYLWFWGGTTLDAVRNTSTTNPVTFHLYPETIPPQQENATARLIVTDTNNVTSNVLVATITFGTAVHELAVLSVEASPYSVLVGNYSNTTVSVNISNNGNQIESTILTLSYNSTYFDFQNLTSTQWTTLYTTPVNALAGLENRAVYYIWNTTGYAQGFYAIKAEASPVSEEANITNNVQIGSMRIVTVLYAPIPVFNFDPASPYAFQGVLFNASMSYDPDGTIESYNWSFGDSNSTTVTGSSIHHVYRKAGSFTVTLTVTDDDAISGETTLSIIVQKLATSISISVSPSATIISLGSTVVISGQVANVQSSVNVTIFKRPLNEDVWSIFADVKTDQNGLYSHDWILSIAGAYEFKAEMNGDDAHEASTSNTLLMIAKYNSSITIFADRVNASLGQAIILNGSISPSTAGAVVTLEYKLNNGSWKTLVLLSTDQTGWYTFEWRPDTAGSYVLRAKWTGNDQSIGSESTSKTVNVTPNFPNPTTYALCIIILVAIIATAVALAWKRRH
jgi:PKD repeat protein